MNHDLPNNSEDSFENLLSAALRDCVNDQPRPGLDRRILANLPARSFPMRWVLWPSLATIAALAVAAVFLNLQHPSAPPANTATQVTATDVAPPAPQWQPSPKDASSRQEALIAAKRAQRKVPRISPRPFFPAYAEAVRAELKIIPIEIAPIEIAPLPSAEATASPIAPIEVKPIQIAPIQISSLTIERQDSNP